MYVVPIPPAYQTVLYCITRRNHATHQVTCHVQCPTPYCHAYVTAHSIVVIQPTVLRTAIKALIAAPETWRAIRHASSVNCGRHVSGVHPRGVDQVTFQLLKYESE